jgi:lipoprotein-releasing system ATP-binding protein
MSEEKIILNLINVKRTFYQGSEQLKVLRGVDFKLTPGEIVALVGPSGSGKSSLLHIAGLLESPDSGEVIIAGQSCARLNDTNRTTMRRKHLGFVYQNHHLLPEFSALENVCIPGIIGGLSRKDSNKRSKEILDWMGLKNRESHRPGHLSGGEQQRVAIARALSSSPSLLLADEPTGNLDPTTAGEVFDILKNLVHGAGLSALIATHNLDLASRMDRTVKLVDGFLEE